MPRSSCDFCCQPGTLGLSVETARVVQLQILCLIADASSALVPQGVAHESNPTVPNITSFTLLTPNPDRKKLFIQNNSAANVLLSIAGAVLTGIVPSVSNVGRVLVPGASYNSDAGFVPTSAITIYQSSGASINTIFVSEGQDS